MESECTSDVRINVLALSKQDWFACLHTVACHNETKYNSNEYP